MGRKKAVYGARGLIAVGGRGEVVDDNDEESDGADDAASSSATKRRTDDTRELAFFHALPSTFWEEVLYDYQIGAVIDVAAGDGSLALAALRARIPYTGVCLTEEHKSKLLSRLKDLLCAGAVRAGDKWYDPTLAKALVQATKSQEGEPSAKAKAKPKKRKSGEDGDQAQVEGGEKGAAKAKKSKGNQDNTFGVEAGASGEKTTSGGADEVDETNAGDEAAEGTSTAGWE